jgi:hypothetical protein
VVQGEPMNFQDFAAVLTFILIVVAISILPRAK